MNESGPRPPRRLPATLKNAGHAVLQWLHGGRVAVDQADSPEVQNAESRRRGFEITDADTVRIAWLCLGLVIVVALSMVVVTVIYGGRFKTQSNEVGAGYQGGATQRTPIGETWKALDAETATHLEGYRWVDKQSGIVQVPIQRAMDLIREKEVQP